MICGPAWKPAAHGEAAARWLLGLVLFTAAHARAQEEPQPAAITVPAAHFTVRPAGRALDGGWQFTGNGALECGLLLPTNGLYTFVLVASGAPAAGEWPRLNMEIDNETALDAPIASSNWIPLTVVRELAAGRRRLAVELWNATTERRLQVAHVTIVSPPMAPAAQPLGDDAYRAWIHTLEQAAFARADARIEQVRTGELTVRVIEPNGAAVAGAEVAVRQIAHEFAFGAALNAGFFQSAPPAADVARALNVFTQFFNCADSGDAFNWAGMEPAPGQINYTIPDRMSAWCLASGVPLHGQGIFQGCGLPQWVAALSNEAREARLLQHVRLVAERYRESVRDWDLLSGWLSCPAAAARPVLTLGPRIFRAAGASAPEAILRVTDAGILEGGNLRRYVRLVRSLLDAGAPVSGLGAQACFRAEPDPIRLAYALDLLAELRLPIRLTGAAFPGVADDRARALETLYRIAFSSPSVSGILLADFWEPLHPQPTAAMWRADGSMTPAAKAYGQLVFDRWWTRANGRTGKDGFYVCRAFYGRHAVAIRAPDGRAVTGAIELPNDRGAALLTLRLPPAAPQAAPIGMATAPTRPVEPDKPATPPPPANDEGEEDWNKPVGM